MIKAILKKSLSIEKRNKLVFILRKIEEYFYNTIDILLYPFTILMAILFKYFRKHSLKNFPFTKRILLKVGVFPILDHYYEPLFNHKHLRYSLRLNRSLPGIDFNDNEQLEILEKFNYNNELLEFPIEKKHDASGFLAEVMRSGIVI